MPDPRVKQKIRGSPPTSAKELAKLGTKTGYLLKKSIGIDKHGKERKKWNRYYCVVKPATYFYYYKSKEDLYPVGVYDLEHYTEVQQTRANSKNNSFEVHCDSRRPDIDLDPIYFDVDAKNAQEMDLDSEMYSWINALKKERFNFVATENEELQNAKVDLTNKLKIAEESVSYYQKKMNELGKKAKEIVKQGMKVTHDLNIHKGNEDVDRYEKIEKHLDIVSSLEKIRYIVEELSESYTTAQFLKEKEFSNEPETYQASYNASIDSTIESNSAVNSFKGIKVDATKQISMKVQNKYNDGKNYWKKLKETYVDHKSKNGPLIDDKDLMSEKKLLTTQLNKQMLNNSGSVSSLDLQKSLKSMKSFKKKPSYCLSDCSTMSMSSTDSQFSAYRGWSKRESRSNPGEFYFVHMETGATCWDLPEELDEDSTDDDEEFVLNTKKKAWMQLNIAKVKMTESFNNKTKKYRNKKKEPEEFVVKEIDESHHQF